MALFFYIMNRKRLSILIILSATVFLLDRLTKMLVAFFIMPYHSYTVLGDFFKLTHVCNPGGAFGTRLGGNMFYIISAIVAIAVVFIWLFKKETSKILLVAISLMLGGAIGNLYDRIAFGTVTDFLDFGIGQIRWPTFNIADSAITIGIVLVIIDGFFSRKNERNPEKD